MINLVQGGTLLAVYMHNLGYFSYFTPISGAINLLIITGRSPSCRGFHFTLDFTHRLVLLLFVRMQTQEPQQNKNLSVSRMVTGGLAEFTSTEDVTPTEQTKQGQWQQTCTGHFKTLSIQVCPKKFWGWDWDHQSYSREGSGFWILREMYQVTPIEENTPGFCRLSFTYWNESRF